MIYIDNIDNEFCFPILYLISNKSSSCKISVCVYIQNCIFTLTPLCTFHCNITLILSHISFVSCDTYALKFFVIFSFIVIFCWTCSVSVDFWCTFTLYFFNCIFSTTLPGTFFNAVTLSNFLIVKYNGPCYLSPSISFVCCMYLFCLHLSINIWWI